MAKRAGEGQMETYVYLDGEFLDRVSNMPEEMATSLGAEIESVRVEYNAPTDEEYRVVYLRSQGATISSRSRNLGYGWRTDAEQTLQGLGVRAMTAPDAVGGLRTIEAEIEYRRRVCGPRGYYREALFVGGRRVRAVWGDLFREDRAAYEAAWDRYLETYADACRRQGIDPTFPPGEYRSPAYPPRQPSIYDYGEWYEGRVQIGSVNHTVPDLVRRLREGESLRVLLAVGGR
jgi:hypothetical protein